MMSLNSEGLSNSNTGNSFRSNGGDSLINVGGIERLACAVAGGALAAYGLRSRTAGGLILTLAGAALVHRGGTGHCNAYQALGITTAASGDHKGSEHHIEVARDVHVEKSIVINRPIEELYAFWREFENLPRFMDHLESVNSVGFNRWHWVAKGPVGTRPEWDAEIYNEKPNELIAWRSLDGNVTNAGSVRFEPGPGERGTQVRVVLNYNAPGGKVSALLAKVFGHEPGQMIEGDLRRLKEMFERGEIARVESRTSATEMNRSLQDDPISTEEPSASMTPASELAESKAASSSR
jgi:uncharacterized membrane protein